MNSFDSQTPDMIALLLLTFPFFLLTSCSPATPTAAPEPITLQYSAAAQPWFSAMYDCADEIPIFAEQRAAQYFDFSSVLAIRLGEPEQLKTPAFKIGVEEIVVAIHPQNLIEGLNITEIRGLFSGRIRNWSQVGGPNAPVRVWLYASGEDIQQIFEAAVMQGAALTSLARLATSPDEMAQAIANDVNAVGILPHRWKTEDVQEVYLAASVPVLAITSAEPQGTIANLITCLQK